MKKRILCIIAVFVAVLTIITRLPYNSTNIDNIRTEKNELVHIDTSFSDFADSYPDKYSDAMYYIFFCQERKWTYLPMLSLLSDPNMVDENGVSWYMYEEDGITFRSDLTTKMINRYADYIAPKEGLGIEKYRQAYYAAYRALATDDERARCNEIAPGWEKYWQENYWSEDYVFDFPSDSYFANTCHCSDFSGGIDPIYNGVEQKSWSSDLEFLRCIRALYPFFDFGMTPSTCSRISEYRYRAYYVASKHDFVRVYDAEYFFDGVFACKEEYMMLRNCKNPYAIMDKVYQYVQENEDELLKAGKFPLLMGKPVIGPTLDMPYIWPMGADKPNDVESYLQMVYETNPDSNGIADTQFADWLKNKKGNGGTTAVTPTATPTETPTPEPTKEEQPVPTGDEPVTPAVTDEPEPTVTPTPTMPPIEYTDIPVAVLPTDIPDEDTVIVDTPDDDETLIAEEITEAPTVTPTPTEVPDVPTRNTEEKKTFSLDKVIPIVVVAVVGCAAIIGAVIFIKKRRR